MKGNQQEGYSNRQAGKCVGQTGFILTDPWLVSYAICVCKRWVDVQKASFGFSSLTDYNWQHSDTDTMGEQLPVASKLQQEKTKSFT